MIMISRFDIFDIFDIYINGMSIKLHKFLLLVLLISSGFGIFSANNERKVAPNLSSSVVVK